MASGISVQRIQQLISEWEVSGGAERGNAHSFLNELCDILEVPRPDKAVPVEASNAYVFEKTIPAPEGSKNFIDLYKRGCSVLETKQGADRDATDPLSAMHQPAKKKLEEMTRLLETLEALGRANEGGGGWVGSG
jgi:hypothetical protein